MINYCIRRLLYMIISLVAMSFFAFVLISLPPGSYVERYVEGLRLSGEEIDESTIEALKLRYGLGQPFHMRYFKWVSGILLRGDFGRSFAWEKPVKRLIMERLQATLLIALSSVLFVYIVSIPIGIYSATHQYSPGDYIATVGGFLGLSIPNFLFALFLMYFLFKYFGFPPGELFSHEYVDAPWNIAKMFDLFKHLIVPVIVIGTAGTAGLIRTLRAALLDELGKQYVVTARAKGLSERILIFKYPVRVAINPVISTVGWIFPHIISGGTIVAIVLNLPTLGPLLLGALMNEDMYLAGSIVLIQTFLMLVGTFISDILLVLADPRIRYE